MRPKEVIVWTPFYMLGKGLLLGSIGGVVCGTLIFPLFGTLFGIMVGAMMGGIGGMVLGIMFAVVLWRIGIFSVLRFRFWLVWLSVLTITIPFLWYMNEIFNLYGSHPMMTLFGIFSSLFCALATAIATNRWLNWLQNSDTRKRKVKL